jgi:hypothetical protein
VPDHPSRKRTTDRRWLAVLVALVVIALLAARTLAVMQRSLPPEAGTPQPTNQPNAASPTVLGSSAATAAPAGSSETVTLVGAGDIASCSSSGDEATSALLDGIPGTVFAAGDNAYADGTSREYADCYGPTWGRDRPRTRPAPGNHDYDTRGAAGYFDYFGAAAGQPGHGWYAYDLGAWRIYVLDSDCSFVGCRTGSPQEQWLRGDLAANPRTCVAAMWHHPRFSDGTHGDNTSVAPFWQDLYDANADLIINGHDHDYQRWAPQAPTGAPDTTRGMVEFVVGTGGESHYAFKRTSPNRVAGDDTTFGVLRLDLSATGYAFRFIPIAGATYTDSGTGSCH